MKEHMLHAGKCSLKRLLNIVNLGKNCILVVGLYLFLTTCKIPLVSTNCLTKTPHLNTVECDANASKYMLENGRYKLLLCSE
jgi:hypothetical protein